MSRIVLAIGGNALGSTPNEQRDIIRETARSLIDLVEAGHQIILTHGNGPQVGMINKAFELASQQSDIPEMPFCECVAMTQGYIGFHLQNSIRNEIMERDLPVWVGALICQVEVDSNDPEFHSPSKPVGSYLSDDEIKRLSSEGVAVMEDAGRGWRRAMPSPAPKRLLEGGLIKKMSEQGYLLIVSGGGGVPVAHVDGHFKGVDAVVDKDKSSALIAKQIEADYFVLLTAVEQVALNFGTAQQKALATVSTTEMQGYVAEGHFAPGSMLPKIEAALDFAGSGEGRVSLVTSLNKVLDGIEGKAGTRIIA
jgi:carbamate kinase